MVLKYILIYFSHVLCVPGIYNIFHCLLKHTLLLLVLGKLVIGVPVLHAHVYDTAVYPKEFTSSHH